MSDNDESNGNSEMVYVGDFDLYEPSINRRTATEAVGYLAGMADILAGTVSVLLTQTLSKSDLTVVADEISSIADRLVRTSSDPYNRFDQGRIIMARSLRQRLRRLSQ